MERPLHEERAPAECKEICERCGGTGLICGHIPVISPGSCCVDYANAICPDCKGAGIRLLASEKE